MFRYLWITLIVIVADQVSKWYAVLMLKQKPPVVITSFFNLDLAFNTGAAFGFLADQSGWQNIFFVVVAIVVSFIIFNMAKRLGANDKQVMIGLMMILGGALGNVIDRLRMGYVVDFLDFHVGGWHWPTFNIADSAITIGAALLILDALGFSWGKNFDADTPAK